MDSNYILSATIKEETTNDELKNVCQIEHIRHRSFANFISNLMGGLTAYTECVFLMKCYFMCLIYNTYSLSFALCKTLRSPCLFKFFDLYLLIQ